MFVVEQLQKTSASLKKKQALLERRFGSFRRGRHQPPPLSQMVILMY
ncbi:hypothetical protein CGSMWGv75712_04640 [Gardnerella vaginalis 75712]|nr:hypothetical protein CGSMWGv75712_04640 [Gardnerella vaginalis 75712]